MEVYNSEDEQVEAIKRWWSQNGRSVITMVAIVLIAVAGWRIWNNHQRTQATAASITYEQMIGVLKEQPKMAEEAARAIVAQYPKTTYADYAALALAKIAVDEDRLDAAKVHLQSVADGAHQPDLRDVGRLRLARVLLAQGKPGDALTALGAKETDSFKGEYEEIKGDIYLAQGKTDEAREAYGNALAAYDVSGKQQIVQMKLDDVATPKSQDKAE